MLSFRQRVFITYFIIFLVFILILFPFTKKVVEMIVGYQLEARATELIDNVRSSPNMSTLIYRLRKQEHLLFSRVSVLNSEGGVFYDSHIEKLLGDDFQKGYPTHHPEVIEAVNSGTGYAEGYSKILKKSFAYTAKSFDFHGSLFVMRTAIPYSHVVELTKDFQIGFLILGSMILVLYSIITWIVIYHFSKPIHDIIEGIKPYQKGEIDHVPRITLNDSSKSKNDFVKLANTLNSLSKRIQDQIDTLKSERNERSAILESLIEGVISVDCNLKVDFANNVALNMLGIDTFINKRLIDYAYNDKKHFFETCHILLSQCYSESKVITDTLLLPSKTYFDIVVAPKPSGAILVLQDKTSHYRILEMRKTFIANASHELKTPITIVRGFAETLQDNPDLDRKTTTGVIDKIIRNCVRMSNLIKNLLALSDIENLPHSHLNYCNLIELLESCKNMLFSIYPDAKVRIIPGEGDFCFVGDIDLFELAVKNLFENAAKYSSGPAEITVTLKENKGFINLDISDKGIGIPYQDQEFIFQRFYTVDKCHSRKLGGSGLGLSIVETIIEKHRGKISLESKLNEGTTFHITIPKEMVDLEKFC